MAFGYLLGFLYAILAGLIVNLGVLMQKFEINKIPPEARDSHGFMKTLLKKPIWIFGIIFMMAGGGVFTILAQAIIGGALVPGLMASGFIVLMIGSIKILGEKLTKLEIGAIILLIIGIASLGLSELVITQNEAEEAFSGLTPGFYFRMGAFAFALVLFWVVSFLVGKKKHNTPLLSLSSGIPFALGNLFMQSLLITLPRLLTGVSWITITFIISTIFVGGVNITGIIQVQYTLKTVDASKFASIQQVAIQLIPVVNYFLVYLKEPEFQKILLSTVGVLIIILCGFVLSKKQAKIDAIK